MTEMLVALMQNEPKPVDVLALLKKMDKVDIAAAFECLNNAESIRLFRMLPKSLAAEVFIELDNEKKQTVIETLTDSEQSFIINDLFFDDAADLIEEMPSSVVKRLLQNATEETRRGINMLLKYPEDSAGSVMTTEYIKLRENQTAGEAFNIIRQKGIQKETIYTCYVTDAARTLIGFVSVKDLIYASPADYIRDIMRNYVVSVQTTNTHDEVSATFTKYGYVSLPVVDSENKLVGVITVDDALRMMSEHHSDIVHKISAVKPHDEAYLKTSVWRHSRNRVMWLLLLMVSAMLTGFVISDFETALVTVPALMAFIPMLMGTGGNAGSQASTQIIRGMAVGELDKNDVWHVLWKEVRVALLCGLVMGAVNFARIIFFDGMVLNHLGDRMFTIASVVTLSLCVTVVMAKSLGCLLPMLARRFKLDPAIMAAPLIATILDTLSLLVYFGIATLLLGL
jgi:magnesium transporter